MHRRRVQLWILSVSLSAAWVEHGEGLVIAVEYVLVAETMKMCWIRHPQIGFTFPSFASTFLVRLGQHLQHFIYSRPARPYPYISGLPAMIGIKLMLFKCYVSSILLLLCTHACAQATCPLSKTHLNGIAGKGKTNEDWWPNKLNIDLLRLHSNKADPFGAAFNYK